MPEPITQPPSPSAGIPSQTIEATVTAEHHFSFHELLSELNPLQYLPIVGTLYRAVTGDTIPDTAREAGSLVVSGLMGGPIGVAVNLAELAIEKITGIDPEEIGQSLLAHLGIGSRAANPVAAAPPKLAAPAPSSLAWSPSQLMAYGVTATADGTLQRGALQGADVLNDMELARHG